MSQTCYDWCKHSTIIENDNKLFCEIYQDLVDPDHWCSQYVEVEETE
jgi:hypothetical protein